MKLSTPGGSPNDTHLVQTPVLLVEPRPDGIVHRVLLPDAQIVCVDCGGTCYPLGWHPEDGEVESGTVVPYRCADCLDRWDIVIEDVTDDATYPDR